jgi:hypothetical protein
MKHLIKLIALATIAVFALAACSAFVFTTSDLKSKTLTYYVNMMSQSANGHDYSVLTFDSTGAAGTFTIYTYAWYYPTVSAYNTGDYTGKEWFQISGAQGTFTYNADSGAVSMSVTKEYYPTAAANEIGTSGYYDAYDWQTLDAIASLALGTTVTGVTMKQDSVVKITADNVNYIYAAGTTVDTWVNTSSSVQTYVVAGTTYSMSIDGTATFTIPSDGSTLTRADTYEMTMSGSSTASENEDQTYNYVVNKSFIVGKDDPANATFSDVWKKGNTVTFMADKTSYTDKYWTSTDPLPSAPTIGADGTGETFGDTDSYYYVNNNVGTATFTFINNGTYMLYAGDLDFAGRHVKPFFAKK